tara:strand:+ start:226 stop:426 length:201 start_codon:yes stop_codon:yes gene_type:complete
MEAGKQRVFLDLNEKEAQSSGIFVRNDLVKIVQEIEAKGEIKVIGIVFDETYNLEIITKEINHETL